MCSVVEGQVLLTKASDSHAVQHISWGNGECRIHRGSRPLVQNKIKRGWWCVLYGVVGFSEILFPDGFT